MSTRWAMVCGLVTIACGALAGCGVIGTGGSTITQQQAIERVDRYLTEAVTALPGEPTLTARREEVSTECLDLSGPNNQIEVSKTYELDGISPDRNGTYFDALRQRWTSHGFRVLGDDRTLPRRLHVEHNTDGFRMGMREASDGSFMLLSVTSPCIWPDGTPVPEP